jgi:sec-independent protein translocase protein TatA
MGEFSVWHWLVVALVFMLLFGATRLPDAARGLGRSMRILKAELRHEDPTVTPDITTTPRAEATSESSRE